MAIGIKVKLTNGDFDWYDPVEWDAYYVDEEGTLHIDNGHEYTLKANEFINFDQYELCPICGTELGTCPCAED